MGKRSTIALLLAAACAGGAAQEVRLSFFPRPALVVQAQTENRMDMEMDVRGEELLRRSREAGAKLPLRLQRVDRQRTRTTTGSPGADGAFPLTLEFLEAEARMVDGSGAVLPTPPGGGSLTGTRVQAQVKPPREVRFVAAEAPAMPPQMRAMLPQLLAGTYQAMEQLEAVTVRPGESATQQVDLQVPMPAGMPAMKVSGQVVYTLREVQAGIARFAIRMQYALDQPPGGNVRVTAQGTGEGTMDYDTANALMTRMETDSALEFHLEVQGGTILQKMRMRQAVRQEASR